MSVLLLAPLASITPPVRILPPSLPTNIAGTPVLECVYGRHSAMTTITVLSSTVLPGASGSATSSAATKRAILPQYQVCKREYVGWSPCEVRGCGKPASTATIKSLSALPACSVTTRLKPEIKTRAMLSTSASNMSDKDED